MQKYFMRYYDGLSNDFKCRNLLSPETLTWNSILSSTASQVYFPESAGVAQWMVRRRTSPSSLMVMFLLSIISCPSSHHLTSALGRDTSISSTIGFPAKILSLSVVLWGRLSITGGSNRGEKTEKGIQYIKIYSIH